MSKSIFKKIWRDLSERKTRTLLTLLGLTIGLWGIASVAVAWRVLDNDLAENFTSTNPPGIVMTIAKGGPIDVSKIRDVQGVGTIENRPEFHGRIEVYQDQWLPARFSVVENFENMNVAKIFPESGTLTPPMGSFVIERDGLKLAKMMLIMRVTGPDRHSKSIKVKQQDIAKLGDDPIALRLEGGRMISAELAGAVHDPAQAPSRMEKIIYGYITRETATSWTDGEFPERLLVTPAEGYGDDLALRQTVARLKTRLKELGYVVSKTSYPSTTDHVHQFQMDSILFLLTGLGVLALMMSVVLVLNLINGILTSQIRQIGILKAIGASRLQVATIYQGSMMILGLVASLIAVPLAIKSGYVVSGALAAFLNFEILTTELPPGFILGIFVMGVAFPMLAALSPVRRWAQVSVIDALQHSGANPPGDKNMLIAKLSLPLSINVAMGVRNAFRKPARLLLTAATVSIGLITFMAAMNMSTSLLYTAKSEETQKRFDLLVTFEQPIDAARVAWMDKFPIVERAETWKITAATLVDDSGETDDVLPLKIMPGESEVMRPFMLAGNWLNPDQAGGVVINQRLTYARPELGVGATINLHVSGEDVTLPVVGVMKEFGGSSIYMREVDYRAHFPKADNLINAAYVTLKDPNEQTLADLRLLLNQHFTMAKVGVSNMLSAKMASRIIRGHLDVIVATLLTMAFLMLFVSSLGMASDISTSVVERTREIGILRAIGGKPSAIGTILVSESMVMALTGWLIALALAQPASWFLTDYFGTALVEYPFDYMGSTEGIFLSLIGTIILAFLATAGPVFMVNRRSVKEAITYE